MESTAEIKRLQSCINDLISVLALPAIWSGSESSQILGTLLESLQTMLRLDFAYARLTDASGRPPIEVVRSADHRFSSVQSQQLGQALDRWLTGDQTASRNVVPDPAGEGEVSIVSFSLGLQHEGGVLVAGSRRADFPTEVERLLLRVAANQAGIGLQEARRSGEQKRIAEVLEQRVAERTRLLTAVNDELRRSEAYLAEAQRLSHTGSWALSANSKIAAYWSEEDFRIWGFDPQKGFPDRDMVFQRIHPEDVGRVNEKSLKALRERTDYTDEFRIVLPDGEVRHIQALAHPVLSASGEIAEYVGTHVDVTERKRAEGALRQRASLLDLTHDSIFVRDMNDVITYWNRGAQELYGWTSEEATGQVSHQFTQTIFPAPLEEINKQLLDTGRWEGELIHSKRDGSRVVVASRWSLQRDELGRPAVILETNTDITERKRAEEEQRRSAEALRQAEADLAHVSRVTTMGELTASLAHEVNQPITAAVTNAKTCVRWLAADTPNIEEARDAALRSAKNGTRAAEIISRIRLLFQKGAPKRELVDINEVIQEIVMLLSSEATRYSISVRAELGTGLPELTGDSVQLQQVIMNLVLNGIEAMKDVDDKRELFIKSERWEKEQVLVSVHDTGVGLPPQQADRIFDAFFTTKLHGTGMGLSISRSIVESHGGRLWADGNSPRGATFFIGLPTGVEAP
jgi:two-component system sensor kinase FixL